MKRKVGVALVLLVVCVVAYAALAVAQETEKPPLMGTVYFQDGRSITGKIHTAEFGVAEFDGIGESITDRGSIKLEVEGKERLFPADDISSIEAQWKNLGDEKKKDWQITSMTITTKDGQKVTGKPTWLLHASYVKIEKESGETERVGAFPLGRTFDPKNLLVKVVLGKEAAPPTAPGTRATPPTTAPTTAPTTTPATAPGATAATPPTTTPATAPTPPIRPPTTTPVRPPVTVAAGTPVTVAITLQCPKCGQFITVDIPAQAR